MIAYTREVKKIRKKIALLHYAAPPVVGGVESVIGHQARLMAVAGHLVRVVAGRGEKVDERVDFVELPLIDSRHPEILAAKESLDSGRVPETFDQLVGKVEALLAEAFDGIEIVVAHNVCSLHKNLALTAALRQYCAREGAPRLVIWHHDLAWTTPRYQPELHDGWPWNLLREHWQETNPKHVVVSEVRRGELATLLSIPEEIIDVVPSGLDVASFLKLEDETLEYIERLGLLEANPLLLLPVRITARKNIELALHILHQMCGRFPSAALVVTGPLGAHNPANQQYFEQLKALRDALDLDPAARRSERSACPAVHFLAEHTNSFIPDAVIADMYRLADVLLLPSREEGFGIPVIEAGLSSMPIFCADIPALRELAGDKATYFPPDGDVQQIAEEIVSQLADDRVLALRGKVKRDYTWQGIYSQRIEPLLV